MTSILFLCKSKCLTIPIQMQLSENQRNFLYFSLHLQNVNQIPNPLNEKISFIRDFFLKL